MERQSKFSYVCNRCGLCCRDKVIALSPYDVIRIARAAKISTGAAVARYTIRRGSLLRFLPDGRCAAFDGPRCTIHPGRPLACRLYPLGLERAPGVDGAGYVERFVQLEPAAGSLGVLRSIGHGRGFSSRPSDAAPYRRDCALLSIGRDFSRRESPRSSISSVSSRASSGGAPRAKRWPRPTTIPIRLSTRCSTRTNSDAAARAPRQPPSRMLQRSTRWRRESVTAR